MTVSRGNRRRTYRLPGESRNAIWLGHLLPSALGASRQWLRFPQSRVLIIGRHGLHQLGRPQMTLIARSPFPSLLHKPGEPKPYDLAWGLILTPWRTDNGGVAISRSRITAAGCMSMVVSLAVKALMLAGLQPPPLPHQQPAANSNPEDVSPLRWWRQSPATSKTSPDSFREVALVSKK